MTAPLLALAALFAELSLLAFGGGNSVLPEMQRRAVEATSAAPAATSPAVTGTSPACTARRHDACRNRSQTRSATPVTMEDGPNIATVATSAPQKPPTRQPRSVTTIMFGPGAAWARPKSALNCAAVIHPCASTTRRCISGRTVGPPPKASSDSSAKSSASARSGAAVTTGSSAAPAR